MIASGSECEVEPVVTTSLSRVRRPRSRSVMQWIRRVHLYSGLFMFPWVMLYGITALLFNHPGAFPDRVRRTLTRADFSGTALEQLANPAADAEQVVAALNAKFAADDATASSFRLVHADQALYTRDVVIARARGAGQEHSVLLDLPSGTASISTMQQDDTQRPPFAVRGLKVSSSLSERIKTGIPETLTRLNLSADDVSISVGSNLAFLIEAEGQLWRALYNVQTGAVTGRPADAPGPLTVRQFVTQLHMSHGYPSQDTTRWCWAIAVDAMFVAMVFWGFSGLLMWWQIKAVRFTGAFVFVSSLIVAALLTLGMHSAIGV